MWLAEILSSLCSLQFSCGLICDILMDMRVDLFCKTQSNCLTQKELIYNGNVYCNTLLVLKLFVHFPNPSDPITSIYNRKFVDSSVMPLLDYLG